MVFAAAGSGVTDLYLMDLATKRVQRLAGTPDDGEIQPRFSPDGRSVAYCSAPPGFDAGGYMPAHHLYVYDLATKSVRQVTREKGRSDSSPAFSRDGRFLVFDGSRPVSRSKYVSDVFTVEIATGETRRLTSGDYNAVLRPRFWREDREVIFTAYHFARDSLGMYLATVPVAGKGVFPPPTAVTPQGGKCHFAQPAAGGRVLMVSNLADASGWDHVCLFDPASQTFDSVASSNHGPTNPVMVGGKVYWMEGDFEVYCLDRAATGKAAGRKTRIADRRLFDRPL